MFGDMSDELYIQCVIDERRELMNGRRAGIPREFDQLALTEHEAAGGRPVVRGWIASVARTARTLNWVIFRRAASDTPA